MLTDRPTRCWDAAVFLPISSSPPDHPVDSPARSLGPKARMKIGATQQLPVFGKIIRTGKHRRNHWLFWVSAYTDVWQYCLVPQLSLLYNYSPYYGNYGLLLRFDWVNTFYVGPITCPREAKHVRAVKSFRQQNSNLNKIAASNQRSKVKVISHRHLITFRVHHSTYSCQAT